MTALIVCVVQKSHDVPWRFQSGSLVKVLCLHIGNYLQVSESGLVSPNATPRLSKQLLRSKSIASSKDTLLIRCNSNSPNHL